MRSAVVSGLRHAGRAVLFALASLAWLCAGLVALAVDFPALTGRIVDQANIIPLETRNAIEPKLVDLEAKSGIQLVIATVNSLQGQEIEPYANELFRTWKLGEKTSDPLQMYLEDIFTVSANLVGLPGISVPCGFSRAGLPIGLQLLAAPFEEEKLLRVARMYERATDWHTKRAPVTG